VRTVLGEIIRTERAISRISIIIEVIIHSTEKKTTEKKIQIIGIIMMSTGTINRSININIM
jgi:hypothetical protein